MNMVDLGNNTKIKKHLRTESHLLQSAAQITIWAVSLITEQKQMNPGRNAIVTENKKKKLLP